MVRLANLELNAIIWNGVELNGVEWGGVGWNGVGSVYAGGEGGIYAMKT